MRHLIDLCIRLKQRSDRVRMTDPLHYETELQLFLQFLDSHPYFRPLLYTLDASEEVDFEQWKDTRTSRYRTFPASETARAKLCLGILKECAYDPHEGVSLEWARQFTNAGEVEQRMERLNEAVLDPLVYYLKDHVEEASNILYLLQRFKLRIEWFRRQELYQTYLDDTRSGEANLDHTLREALFDGGVDFPFSQPNSPSGRADIVSLDDLDDPLVLEVKVFDPERGKDRSHLRQGFHQVLRYANDYQQNVGYLVVFNCSDNQLVWPSEDSSEGEFPPRFVHDAKTFFLISIDIGTNRESASKEKPADRTVITREDLSGQADGR